MDRIWAHGGQVIRDGWRLRLQRGRLSDEAVKWISEHRHDLMAEIWPEYHEWEERAGIREFDGGQPREVANDAAYAEVMAREPMPYA